MGESNNLPHEQDDGPVYNGWTEDSSSHSYNIAGLLQDVRDEAEAQGGDGEEAVDLVIETVKHIVLDIQKYLDGGESPSERDIDCLYPVFNLLESILSDEACGCELYTEDPTAKGCTPDHLLLGYIPQGNGMYKDSSVGKLRLESDWDKYKISSILE